TGIEVVFYIFFFQAEDGIRDADMTGVQTCALPIYIFINGIRLQLGQLKYDSRVGRALPADILYGGQCPPYILIANNLVRTICPRSEERRVGKECKYGLWE